MNQVLNTLLDEIDHKLRCVEINFEDRSWRENIPSESGWYLVKTNTPIDVLRSIEQPKYEAHINIPDTIQAMSGLRALGITIEQSVNNGYVVYNGEAKNLKARAREHECGHEKTYCLGLGDYEVLRGYKWTFCYVAASWCKTLPPEDKALRLAVEQGWRAKHGWPILCKK